MNNKLKSILILLTIVRILLPGGVKAEETLKFVLMASKDPVKAAQKFKALSNYLASKTTGVDSINLKVARDYPHAVELFRSGKVNGMFAGSFVAAMLIKKGVAVPTVRPVLNNGGVSTYKALVIAKKGTPKFKGISDLKEKTVADCALASSGEIFARKLLKAGESPSDYYTPILSKNREDAIKAVVNGTADFAVAKNLIWDEKKYPTLAVVGGDSAMNPNNTLVLTKDTYNRVGKAIENILIGISYDKSAFAEKVKNGFDVSGFIKTTNSDFEHTFDLIKHANINPIEFDFKF